MMNTILTQLRIKVFHLIYYIEYTASAKRHTPLIYKVTLQESVSQVEEFCLANQFPPDFVIYLYLSFPLLEGDRTGPQQQVSKQCKIDFFQNSQALLHHRAPLSERKHTVICTKKIKTQTALQT